MNQAFARTLASVSALALYLLMLLDGHPAVAIAEQPLPASTFDAGVVEHLPVKVLTEAHQSRAEAAKGD